MFMSVRDTISLLEYRSVVSEQFMQVATTMVKNYGEVPAFIEPHARRPELAMFDGEVHIMGSAQDLPFYCAYMKLNPSTEYAVSVYTDEEAARERAISVFGADPEEVLALASMTQPETVAEELLEDGDLMEARFSRASNKQSLKSRADNPLNRFRTVSNISNVIKTSIVGFDAKKVNKAPLLIGHSGISKSASVKSVIKELNSSANEAAGDWGYRLVDIRAAFFDKMDMLGMITLTSETDGSDGSLLSQMNERWTDSPKLELLTCTTPFVESCRSMVKRIDSGDVEVNDNDKEFESRLREYAKTPVMFFDEINRTPKEVMNQLMVMINGHALNDYDISIAPKLAAANLPVEMDKLDDLDPEQYEKLIYLVQNVDDAAKIDRFIPYVVSSSDPSIQKGAFDYLIELDIVKKHPQLQELARFGFDQQSLHDISAMDSDGKFPTFRGWEDTMKYLAWCLDNNEVPYRQVISGILGATTTGGVMRWLESSGIEVDIATNDSESFIDHTYRAGLPLMLLGRMGIAKTAGINKAIKKNNDEAIRIDLSSTDRVNVGGFPRPAPFLREAFGFGFKEKGAVSKEDALNAKMAAVTSPLFEAFEAEVKQNGEVPHQTTSYIPNKQLQDQLDSIRESQEEGKRLVLVFDEINRCTPVVQSAVFEAISDCFVGDTKIRLLDGTTPTMKELYEKYGTSKEGFWLYASTAEGGVVPAYAHTPRVVSGKTKKLVRVTLDNGQSEICTDDHRWRLREGSYVEAKNLTAGMSLMPLYTKKSSKQAGDQLEGYEQLWDNEAETWYYTHRHVANYFGEIPHMRADGSLDGDIRAAKKGVVVHHVDINKLNNDPSNLAGMYFMEHTQWHGNNLALTKANNPDFEKNRLAGLDAYHQSMTDEQKDSRFGRNDDEVQARRAASISASYTEDDIRLVEGRKNLIRFNMEETASGRRSERMKQLFADNPELVEQSRQKMIALNERLWSSEEYAESREKHREAMKRSNKIHTNRPENKARMKAVMDNYNQDEVMKKKQILGRCFKVFTECLSRFGSVDELKYEQVRKEIAPNQPSYAKMIGFINDLREANADVSGNVEQMVNYNHKVVSVEFLDYQEDVYDITVDEYHNFALASGVFVHNSRLFGCDLSGIEYSVIAAGNYDDSEGFDAESGSMGSTFDAAPIDTATMHRFATKITREVSLSDTEQFIEYLESELPAAHYVAKKMGAETLMDLLNTPYDEMADDYDDENEGGLASPVFTMRTLQALHNMMVTNHPYIYANIALSEAAVAAGGADPALAQAQAFIAISENPDLILFKEDPNMGYPLRDLKSTGLHDALELPNTSTVPAKDIFNAIRDICIGIANGDMDTISRLKDQFGNLTNFMFRCQAVIEEIENALDDASVQLTYAGIVPDYAKDAVGEALEEYYVEKSVAAAQVAGFEPLDLFNESASDEELEGLINRHMAMVASETTLDFNELFIRLLEDTLSQNTSLKPSAAHLLRLKSVYNGHPLAAARPITDARISMFLNDYRNKVAGADKAVETLNKLVVDMTSLPKIVVATSLAFHAYAASIGKKVSKVSDIETVILPAISSGTDIFKKAASNDTATTYSWIFGSFNSVKEGVNYLRDNEISPLQAVALLTTMMEARGRTSIDSIARYCEDSARFEVMALGSVNAHDGHIYPDYSTLHRFDQGKGAYANMTVIGKSSLSYALNFRDVLPLSRIDNGSRNTAAAKENPDWFLDLVYKGNRYGVAITLRVEDAIAVPHQQLMAVPLTETPELAKIDGDGLRRLALAIAQATMEGQPARPESFMGDEGAGNLGALANLSEGDIVHSATFAQINYEASFVKSGGTKEVDKLTALDVLRSPSALATSTTHDFTDTQIVMAGIANTRSVGAYDEDKMTVKVAKNLRDTLTSMNINPAVVDDFDVGHSVSYRQQQLVNKDMSQAYSRYARLLRDVWS